MDHFLKPGALRSTVVFLTLFLNDSSCHSFIGVESHFQLITGYGGVLSTAVSCQPGVVSDPESTLIQDFASISRPASAASRPLSRAVGPVSSPCTATMSGKRASDTSGLVKYVTLSGFH